LLKKASRKFLNRHSVFTGLLPTGEALQ
jgi:hypothetical protein